MGSRHMGSLLLCAGAPGKRYSLPTPESLSTSPGRRAMASHRPIEIRRAILNLLRSRFENRSNVNVTRGSPLTSSMPPLKRDKFVPTTRRRSA